MRLSRIGARGAQDRRSEGRPTTVSQLHSWRRLRSAQNHMRHEAGPVRGYGGSVLAQAHARRLVADDPTANDGISSVELRQERQFLAHEAFGPVSTHDPRVGEAGATSSIFAPSVRAISVNRKAPRELRSWVKPSPSVTVDASRNETGTLNGKRCPMRRSTPTGGAFMAVSLPSSRETAGTTTSTVAQPGCSVKLIK